MAFSKRQAPALIHKLRQGRPHVLRLARLHIFTKTLFFLAVIVNVAGGSTKSQTEFPFLPLDTIPSKCLCTKRRLLRVNDLGINYLHVN